MTTMIELRKHTILWRDENGFVILKDRYTRPKRPTATMWHQCDNKKNEVGAVYCPQLEPQCMNCGAHVSAKLVGFWELVRYGQEQG